MGRVTLTERVTRVEERQKHMAKDFDNHVQRVNKKLEVINREQGETRDAVKALERLINTRVSAPMTGRDKAVLYGSAITSLCTVIGLIVQAYFNYLGGLG